jgi:FkbM family methyltransferase
MDYKLLDEIFVQQLYNVRIPNVQRIVDLGANVGMASVYLARTYPGAEIACVEPSPKSISFLKHTLELNAIRAEVFEAAIGTTDGTINLNISEEPAGDSLLTPAGRIMDTIPVRMISMASLMRELKWTTIDVLKMDIEGYEKFLMKENTAWLNSVRLILGELHAGAGYMFGDVEQDLKEFGFELKRIGGNETDSLMFSAVNTKL